MIHKKSLLILGLSACLLAGSPHRAAAQLADFQNQILADYQTITNFVNGQMSKSICFFSTLGWQNAPTVFDFLGNPRVQAGFGMGVDAINISNINNLQLKALVGSSNVNMPSVLPAPFPMVTLRTAIIPGLDVGAKLLHMPPINVPSMGFSGQYTGWGLDMRYRFLDRFPLPVIAVGASWDTLYGSTTIATSVLQSSVYYDPGANNASITGNTNYDFDWNVKSFGARLMVGENCGEFFPYVSVGFQRNSGWIRSSVIGHVTATVNSTTGSPISLDIQNAGQPVVLEPKFVLGFMIGDGFSWNVVGESNGSDIAGSTGFGIQF